MSKRLTVVQKSPLLEWRDAEHDEGDGCERCVGARHHARILAVLFSHGPWSSQDRWSAEEPKDKGVSLTDLTKSSLARLSEWLKLALFIACQQGSKVMPGAQQSTSGAMATESSLRQLRANR